MIPFNPLDMPPGVSRQYLVGRGIFMVGALSMAGFILATATFGFLAGGQFGPRSDIKWDVLVPWPAVAIPAWLVVAACLLAPVGALVLAPRASWEHAPDLIWFIAVTIVLFVVIPVGLSVVYPDAGGADLSVYAADYPRGEHWRGALPQVVTVVVLGVRLAMLAPRYNAVRRQQLESLR